uniref:Uncharacterized protein n=1 Tax=Rhizophora mucronata TaxID=61149 RepID=A0A2P2QS09_RHIMU
MTMEFLTLRNILFLLMLVLSFPGQLLSANHSRRLLYRPLRLLASILRKRCSLMTASAIYSLQNAWVCTLCG